MNSVATSKLALGMTRHINIAFACAVIAATATGPTASALDLSPLTKTVNNVVNKPLDSLPVIGTPLAKTTDTLLTTTVPKTVGNLTQNLPEPVNNKLDTVVEGVNKPVRGVTNTLQPLTDGVAETVENVTDSLPTPVNNLLNAVEAPVQEITNGLQPALTSVPAVADGISNATRLPQGLSPGEQQLPTSPPALVVQPSSDTVSPSKDKLAVNNTTATSLPVSGGSSEQPQKEQGSMGIFDPLIRGWQTVFDWVASQPLINILILAGLLALGAAATIYTFLKDRKRQEIIERDPKQKKQILLSKYTVLTAALLSVGTGLCYVILLFV